MLQVKKFTFNPFAENTYIIWCDESSDAAIIDPGCFTENERRELSEFIVRQNINIKYLFLTHAHIDHIIGCGFVVNNYNPKFYIPEGELIIYNKSEEQAAMFGIKLDKLPEPQFYFNENEKLKVGNSEFQLLFTPGHSPGEFSFYFEKEKICFTGDVLFEGSIGRTDLWFGDFNILINSIKTKLLILPEETKIYTGHGEDSTIKIEKETNPFLIDL